MKHIMTAFLLLTTLHAGGSISDALFGTVTGVRSDDTLSVRSRPDYHAKKIGTIPPKGFVGVDQCIRKGRSIWCRVHQLAQYYYPGYGYGAPEGWVNARYLRRSSRGYVLFDGKGRCDYVLDCYKGVCSLVTDIKANNQGEILSFRTRKIARHRLRGASHFGAASDTGGDGYCTDGQRIKAYLQSHPRHSPASDTGARPASDRILHAIQTHAYAKLPAYIHPVNGMILTEMVSFADTHRIHLSRSAFRQAFKSGKVFYWGDTYGRGDPIRMNLATYFNHLTRRSAPNKVKTFPASEKHFPLKSVHPRRGFEYYWIKSHSKTKEYDWQGLVFILEQYHSRWYLIGVMRDRWTI